MLLRAAGHKQLHLAPQPCPDNPGVLGDDDCLGVRGKVEELDAALGAIV